MSADRLVERARVLLEVRRFDDAVRTLGQAIAAEPDSVRAWCLLAVAHAARHQPEEMLRAANRAVAAGPSEEWGHRLASVALAELGQLPEAARAAAEAVRLEPEEHRTHLQYALVAARLPAFAPAAMAAAHRAAALHPESADVAFAVARASEANGVAPHVVAGHYEQALRLDPAHVNARINLTNLGGRLRLGRRAAGYAAALRLDPGAEIARGNLELMAAQVALRIAGLGWLALVLCALLAADDTRPGFSVARASVGVLLLLASAGWAWAFLRRVPSGAVVYLRSRLRHRSRVLACSLVAVVALATALVSSLAPAGGAVAVAVVAPATWVVLVAVLRGLRRRVVAATRRVRRRRAAGAQVTARDDADRS